MKPENNISSVLELNYPFPNLLVKTRYGNVHLKSLIGDKRTIVYTNPIDLIPRHEQEIEGFIQELAQLKKLNFSLFGFNKGTFQDHLKCLNWVNSYLGEEQVFPVFYEPDQVDQVDQLTIGSADLKETKLINPVYFLDKDGFTKLVLNGINPDNRKLGKILEMASKMVLSEQRFNSPIPVRN
ncbi:MAG: hypothetical protein WD398_13000 [Cyclobacteriaceae bacterium]